MAGICRADDTLPKGFDVARYQQLWERNPFTLVTPSLGQGPASPFSKLILVNWLHNKDKDILFVEDTETNEVKKVTKDESTNSDRLRLAGSGAEPKPKPDRGEAEQRTRRGGRQVPVRAAAEQSDAYRQYSGSKISARPSGRQ